MYGNCGTHKGLAGTCCKDSNGNDRIVMGHSVRNLCPASCQEQDQLKACGGTVEDHTETYKQADAATKAAVAIS
jgi:hypothetical protein